MENKVEQVTKKCILDVPRVELRIFSVIEAMVFDRGICVLWYHDGKGHDRASVQNSVFEHLAEIIGQSGQAILVVTTNSAQQEFLVKGKIIPVLQEARVYLAEKGVFQAFIS